MNTSKKKLIVVGGPTASGKTTLAIALAQHFQTEIISFDARQFYAEMNIGTAKPTREELAQVPHHFIGHKSIKDNYNAGDFEKDADGLSLNLLNKYNVLIATGGSGLYLDAWLNGLNQFPEVNAEVRNELIALYEKEGISALQILLKEKDPAYYRTVDLFNHRRLIRALEICLSARAPYSTFLNREPKKHLFDISMIGIDLPRKILYERINLRVNTMIEKGLEEEAYLLYPYRHYKALHTIGYSEWFEYFEKRFTREETILSIKQNTRNYAKRQMTWFRRYEQLHWIQQVNVKTCLGRLGL